jgi:hypothetical protein
MIKKITNDTTNAMGPYTSAGIGPRFPTNTNEKRKKTRTAIPIAKSRDLENISEKLFNSAPVICVNASARQYRDYHAQAFSNVTFQDVLNDIESPTWV